MIVSSDMDQKMNTEKMGQTLGLKGLAGTQKALWHVYLTCYLGWQQAFVEGNRVMATRRNVQIQGFR